MGENLPGFTTPAPTAQDSHNHASKVYTRAIKKNALGVFNAEANALWVELPVLNRPFRKRGARQRDIIIKHPEYIRF